MRILIFLLFTLAPFLTIAQSRSFDCLEKGALEAKESQSMLSKVQDEYSRTKTLAGGFAQDSYNAALEISEAATGKFYFEKPGKMRWLYETPRKQDFIAKEHTIWLYQEEDRQVLIDRFEDVLLTDLPIAFLMGLGDLSHDFQILNACRGPDGIVFDLKSQNDSASQKMAGFKLLVAPGSYFAKGASVKDLAGNVTSIVLEGVEPGAAIPKGTFTPTFPDGVDIQDRRLERTGRKGGA